MKAVNEVLEENLAAAESVPNTVDNQAPALLPECSGDEAGSEDSQTASSEAGYAEDDSCDQTVAWIRPPKGLIHFLADSDDLTPLCSRRPLRDRPGTERGEGLEGCFALGSRLCPTCMQQAPQSVLYAIMDASTVEIS